MSSEQEALYTYTASRWRKCNFYMKALSAPGGPLFKLDQRKGIVMFCRVPDLVVYPASQEQVETLVQLAKEMNTVIIPFGGGVFFVKSIDHRIERVRGFLSSRPNWLPPHRECLPPPPFGSSLWGEGARGANSDEGRDTLVLYVYYNPSKCHPRRTGPRFETGPKTTGRQAF